MSGVGLRLLPMGEAAVLAEVGTIEQVLALHDRVREALTGDDPELAGVDDLVPAARTLLVRGAGLDLAAVRRRLTALAAGLPGDDNADDADDAERPATSTTRPDREPVVVEVRYDGADLAEVAALTGLSEQQVVAAHTGTPWRVGFFGFAPGFAYLVGGDPRLRVPRRQEPRTRVPAGAVALAGEFSAVYPRSSPGGWQLIGTTDAVLWRLDREPPALLTPGDTVRFEAVDR